MLHLEKTVAWDLLQKEILEKMKYFLRPTVCIQVCKHFEIQYCMPCIHREETGITVESEIQTSVLRED